MDDNTEEREFYKNGSIIVTNARFRVGTTTYAMQGVTSVKKHKIDANRLFPIIMMVVGLGMLFLASFGWKIAGVVICILAVVIFKAIKDEFVVVLNSSSGESQALKNTDQTYIDNVIDARNNAIVHRG